MNQNKKGREPFKIYGVEFVYLCVFGIIVAALGWLVENTSRAITDGIIDSRFHVLPFISVYALIVFAFHIALGTPDDICVFGKHLFREKSKKTKILSNVISYLVICFFVFAGELAVGNLWDICFGVELWDYSLFPLNVTQYTSIVSTFGFGTGAYLLFKFLYTPILRLLREKMSYKTAKIITMTLGTLIVLDLLFLIIQIVFFNQANTWWSIYLPWYKG